MNIAFVLPYLADRFGGPVTGAKNIGPRLVAMGHNVSYWATVDKNDRQELAEIKDVHLYDTDWPHKWYRSRGFVRGMSARISSIDIVQIEEFWPYMVYAASRIAQSNNVPYVISPSGSLGHWCLRSTPLKWLKKKVYLNLIGKSLMQGAACLHACTTQEADHFREVGYDGPITVIPNGVDTSELTIGDGSEAEIYWPMLKDRPVVLFMSRLSPEKGLDILIPAWAALAQSAAYEDALLVIAGPDDRGYGKVVEAMIDKYRMGSRVLMAGMVQGQKKLAILRRADVFILPSYSENFGIVVAEALACGTPVITTTGTPWKQLQDVDAGRWVLPRRPELCQALHELLDMSTSQRRAMGRRGRELVAEQYNWDRVAKQLITVYRHILYKKEIPLFLAPISS
jgi:glycosyltransferase involved in cell wall biosynthesis